MVLVRAVTFAALSAATFAVVSAQQPSPSPATEPEPVVVPVHHEPHHRQVFQFGTTRILDLQIPPNDISLFHSHDWPVLYVTLSTSTTRTQNLGQEWSGGGAGGRRGAPAPGAGRGAAPGAGGGTAPSAPPATADGRGAPPAAPAPGRGRGPGGAGAAPRATSTTSYITQPITHRLENTGTGLFRAMVVVNETQGDETVTEQAAGFDGKPELTNKWFRAYRITLAPGEKTQPHRHRAPVAIFQAIAGKATGSGGMKWEFNEPGQWAFFDTGDQHEVHNTGTGNIELIEVEVRRPQAASTR